MSDKVKVTKITVKAKGGKEIELTLDEAKEMHRELEKLFGEKHLPSTPLIIYRDFWRQGHPYWTYSSDRIEYNGDTGLSMSLSA